MASINKQTNQAGVSLPLVLLTLLLIAAGGSIVLISTNIIPNPQKSAETQSSLTSTPTTPISLELLTKDQVDLENIAKSPSLKKVTTLPDGSIEYRLASYLPTRDNLLIAKGNKISYKRIINFTQDKPLPTLSSYREVYGAPSSTAQGSRYYGSFLRYYLYPEKGLSLIANPNTSEVFEAQYFTPTTLEDFKANWGEDILNQTYPEIGEDFTDN